LFDEQGNEDTGASASRRRYANINFTALRALLRHLGFLERIRGSHHIFTREGVAEILNLQGQQGQGISRKQVRNVIVANRLALASEETSSEATEANETNQADADKKEESDAGKDSV
jgi:predicted RNA binding protein YcfA (HicA-like mRNA interferase family)